MVKFLTDEWLELFTKTINQDVKFKEGTKKFEGTILLEILPSLGLKEPHYVYLNLRHGKCIEEYLLTNLLKVKPYFTFSGPYNIWKKIIDGKLSLLQCLFSGEFKFKGDLSAARALWSTYIRVTYELSRVLVKSMAK